VSAVDVLVSATIPEPPALNGVVIAFDGTPWVRVAPDADGRDFVTPLRLARQEGMFAGSYLPERASWLDILGQGSARVVWNPATHDDTGES
jgi:hypothetical protein